MICRKKFHFWVKVLDVFEKVVKLAYLIKCLAFDAKQVKCGNFDKSCNTSRPIHIYICIGNVKYTLEN